MSEPKRLIFVPDGIAEAAALSRTTDLCIAAHQDDIEIMGYGPISKCYNKADKWFAGVTVTDGAGSPRAGVYADYTDEDMKKVRIEEQNQAASVGRYAFQAQLRFTSAEVKSGDEAAVRAIAEIIKETRPEIIYTHNLADKHDTHVAVALRVIEAVRSIEKEYRPKKLYGLEVWRSLDWLRDSDKAVFDTGKYENIAEALLAVYDSQISGGKRYDKAAMGRRLANATFFESHSVDDYSSASFGIDMTELMDSSIPPLEFILRHVDNFKAEISGKIDKLSPKA